MDGDQAPLRQLVALKEKYGAWLMVDEAHATGLYGLNGRGLAEELGVGHRIEIQMGTLGKALGASGGYICGSRTLIDYLVNRARSFIFSTAPVPAAVAAATAGVRFVRSSAGRKRRDLLWQRVSEVRAFLAGQDRWPCPSSPPCAIIPLMIGEEERAVGASAALRDQGIFIPAIRYPTVPRGQARLRLTLTAAHTRPTSNNSSPPSGPCTSDFVLLPCLHPLARLDQLYLWHPFTQMRTGSGGSRL